MAKIYNVEDFPKKFPKLKNDLVIRVANGENVERIPIWIMRQAGRYLPEFLELRVENSFFNILENPSLTAEVTLMPIKRFDLDAAIIFSDILVVPQALGMKVTMEPGIGPVIAKPIRKPSDVDALNFNANIKEALKGTLEGITITRHLLEGKVPLFGFCGAPWTLMGYMIEGKGSKTLTFAKSWLYKYPKESKELLSLLALFCAKWLALQVAAGAQMLQVFESHADLIGKELFEEFCIPALTLLMQVFEVELQTKGLERVPIIIFARGAHYALKEVSKLGFNVVGLDWTIPTKTVRSELGKNVVVQGNLDPCALFAPDEEIRKLARAIVQDLGPQRLIFNLGHGIYPETPISGVKTLVDAIHSIPTSK